MTNVSVFIFGLDVAVLCCLLGVVFLMPEGLLLESKTLFWKLPIFLVFIPMGWYLDGTTKDDVVLVRIFQSKIAGIQFKY